MSFNTVFDQCFNKTNKCIDDIETKEIKIIKYISKRTLNYFLHVAYLIKLKKAENIFQMKRRNLNKN